MKNTLIPANGLMTTIYESQAGGPLVATRENEGGELVPARQEDVYELFK